MIQLIKFNTIFQYIHLALNLLIQITDAFE